MKLIDILTRQKYTVEIHSTGKFASQGKYILNIYIKRIDDNRLQLVKVIEVSRSQQRCLTTLLIDYEDNYKQFWEALRRISARKFCISFDSYN